MDICEKVKEAAMQSGMWQANFINTKDLVFYPEIREICKGNSCRNYGATWACPPAIGTIDECKKRVMQYEKMLLFSIKYELEDSFDIEGMSSALLSFKGSVDVFEKNSRCFYWITCYFQMRGVEGVPNAPTPIFPAAFQNIYIIPLRATVSIYMSLRMLLG